MRAYACENERERNRLFAHTAEMQPQLLGGDRVVPLLLTRFLQTFSFVLYDIIVEKMLVIVCDQSFTLSAKQLSHLFIKSAKISI